MFEELGELPQQSEDNDGTDNDMKNLHSLNVGSLVNRRITGTSAGFRRLAPATLYLLGTFPWRILP